MISTQTLKRSLVDLGYRKGDVLQDYRFASVDVPGHDVHQVDVAAFLDTPASYKTAALAIVRSDHDVGAADIAMHQSLGAPYLIALTKRSASAWTYSAQGPTKLRETALDNWRELLTDNTDQLRPQAIRELKTTWLRTEDGPQSSLFDPTTLSAVQAKTQLAVHELLQRFLEHFDAPANPSGLSLESDFEALFRIVFRMLAGKILVDREDAQISAVAIDDAQAILDRIQTLYSLNDLGIGWNAYRRKQLEAAWLGLRTGLYVRNVAAEDLAFVYENTLISPAVRKRMGTHSTPSCVAEYVVRSFALPNDVCAEQLSVYEPFAGSCVFLTSALSRLKELLPASWSPLEIHEHLVRHFQASELDPFAVELAKLSLMLADYPNHNGWRIEHEDIFADGLLKARCLTSQITLCNPPFEDFEQAIRGISVHKPVAALDAILDANPHYLGIVMPDGFTTHKKYGALRDRVVRMYGDVEILKLPEGAFRKASVGAEVLIAQQFRTTAGAGDTTRLCRSVVNRSDWDHFQQTLRPSTADITFVDPGATPGLTGLRPLRDLWQLLEELPRLGSVARVHRGLEWVNSQKLASQDHPKPGFKPGLHCIAGGIEQFHVVQTRFLDCQSDKLKGRALKYPWNAPKIICNAVRSSRGPWRLAAAVDTSGLVVSQQFFGIWLNQAASQEVSSLVELTCILNSPLSNAYSFCHDPEKRLRVGTMQMLPIPKLRLASSLSGLFREYVDLVSQQDVGPLFALHSRSASDVLLEIDAVVLEAYDLPPRMERELLRFVSQGERPVSVPWTGYPAIGAEDGAIPLGLRLTLTHTESNGSWIRTLGPLPEEVADVYDQV